MTESQYPPLPEPEAGVTIGIGVLDLPFYTESQMRTYIDADRAQRKPLTDEQCKAIAIALDSWAMSVSREFGLPLYYDPEVWCGIISRAALNPPPRPDAGNN